MGGVFQNIGVILAGGLGERFWPITSPKVPKYALKFSRRSSLLQATYRRLRHLYSRDRIFIITNEQHVSLVRRMLPELPKKNILAEPERRNTAGAVTYTTLLLKRLYGPETVLSFFPADARIRQDKKFYVVMKQAQICAGARDLIVTVGIKPTYPATGYGYIECGKALERSRKSVYKVRRFVEKPYLATARRFFSKQRFLWNAGIFSWKIRVFEHAMRAHADFYFRKFQRVFDQPRIPKYTLKTLFKNLPALSIDRLLIEKTPNLGVIRGDFDWDDIGSWDALRRMDAGRGGNVITARGIFEGARNSVIMGDPQFRIIAAGVRDLVIAQKDQDILVCDIRRSQDITRLKRAVERNRKRA